MGKTKVLLLLVEDNAGDVRLVEEMLRGAKGFELVAAERLSAGLERLAARNVDVVLLDLGLPDSSGMATVEAMRAEAPHLPIIILTGQDDDALAVEAVKMGAQDYLVKGKFDSEVLVRSVRYAIGREQAEQALRESEGRYRTLFGGVADGILVHDEDGIVLDANEVSCARLGRSPSELKGMNIRDLVTDANALAVAAHVRKTMQDGMDAFETVFVSKAGETIPCEVLEHAIEYEGEPAILSAARDISRRKRVETALRLSEAKYRSLVEQNPAVLYTAALDADSTLLFLSPQVERLSGYTHEEYEADPELWRNRIYDDDRKRVATGATGSMSTGRPYSVEYRMAIRDGGTIWVRDESWLIRDGTGLPLAVQGVIHDITPRKLAEEELARNLDVQNVVNSLLRYSLADESIDRMLEHTLDLVLSISWLSLQPGAAIFLVEDDPQALVMKAQRGLAAAVAETCAHVRFGECLCGRAASTQEVHFADDSDERHERHRDGDLPHGHWCVPLLSAGRTLGMMTISVKEGTCHDRRHEESLVAIANVLTGIILRAQAEDARTRVEEQLRQAARLEAIGTLAGGIAHDFNNILTGIMGFTKLLLEEADEGSSQVRDLRQIDKLSERAALLTRQLLSFSRRQPLQHAVLNINDLVQDTSTMLRRIIREDVDLHVVLASDLGNVRVDPAQMEQVLVNIAVNARDAMPEGGGLTIETMNVELDDSYAREHAGVTAGPYVMLALTDTGCGMGAETRERIFEPFFTTKEVGKGTGLGLATVYGIVKQHGGNVWVYSEPGQGTTFKVYLPRVEVEAERRMPTQPVEAPAGGTETILLVEDEKAVLGLTKRVLEAKGYTVLAAPLPAEAEKLFDEHADDVALLLTDVVLPGCNGRELCGRLRVRRPALKVLYVSGYTANAMIDNGVLEQGEGLLEKPFTPHDLAVRVRQALDTEPQDADAEGSVADADGPGPSS